MKTVLTFLPKDKAVRVTYLIMLVGFILAFVGNLPIYASYSSIGYSMNYSVQTYTIQVFGFSISASKEVVTAVHDTIALIGSVGIGVFLLGLVRAVGQVAGTNRVFGKFGLIFLTMGAGLFFLIGLMDVISDPFNSGDVGSFAYIARYVGIAFYAIGVLCVVPNVTQVRPIDKWIGGALIGLGTMMLLILTSTIIIGEYGLAIGNDVAFVEALFFFMYIPLILIGVLWIERSIFRSWIENNRMLRASIITSLCILFIGATYLYLFLGPFREFDWNDWSAIQGPWMVYLQYFYTLGIFLILGITMVMSMKGLKAIKETSPVLLTSVSMPT